MTTIDTRPWVYATTKLIRHLYEDLGQTVGGPLHVILDDGNVDDIFIGDDPTRYEHLFSSAFEFYADPDEDVSMDHREAIRDTCERILVLLRSMPVSDRKAAIRQFWVTRTS